METNQKEQVPSYEMFTEAGNKACHSLVKKIVNRINGKTKITEGMVLDMVKEGMAKISEKHGEVYDTEPEYHIQERVNKALRQNGYAIKLDRYNF